MRRPLVLTTVLLWSAGCGQTGVSGLDPLMIRLDRLDLRWVYGQEEPGGELSARVEIEFDEPWDLCIIETAIEQVHSLGTWPSESGADLPLSTNRSRLQNRKVGKAVQRLTLAGPVSRVVPKDVRLSLSIYTCGLFDLSGRRWPSTQFLDAPDPALVPIWRASFEPTNE
jgi:hypothetical protein